MAKTKYVLIFIFLLNILLFSKCFFFDDEVGMKVFSCMNVMDKKFKKEQQPNAYSPTMLTCFIRITKFQTEKVLSDFERGTNSLEPEEINDLTNVDYLRTIPEKELKKKSAQLENIINEFQQFDHDFSKLKESKKLENDDYDNDNDNEDDNDDNSFKKYRIKKGKRKQNSKFENNLWIPISGLIFISVILIISWLLPSDPDNKKDNKDGNKDDNKNDDKQNEKEKQNNDKKEKEIIKEKEKEKPKVE